MNKTIFQVYNSEKILAKEELSTFIGKVANFLTCSEADLMIQHPLTGKNKSKEKGFLLLPPDISRLSSGAGDITKLLYHSALGNEIKKIIPATGTHTRMSSSDLEIMFSSIPKKLFGDHNWQGDLLHAGTIPEDFIQEKIGISQLQGFSIPVTLNKEIFNRCYSTIISIGQVVPHEILGMANHNKNILIGLGGKDIINLSHYIGAIYGMEKLMGVGENPVRDILNYAEDNFLHNLNIFYILTVTGYENTRGSSKHGIKGIFAGYGRECFKAACKAAEKENIICLPKKPLKIIAYLNEKIQSTWIGNKAIYRSRLAIQEGGELLIIAPNVKMFGEDSAIDAMIQKYGYRGKEAIIKAVKENSDLRENLSAAAHLIHGSTEGRFKVTWAPGKLTEKEITKVGYSYADISSLPHGYMPENLKPGFNTVNNEELYYINDPGQGLWIS